METLRTSGLERSRATRQVLGTAAFSSLLGLSLAGCGHPAEKAVKRYLNQKDCKDRAQFILEPERHRDALTTYYRDRNGCVEKHGKIEAASCTSVGVGDYCSVAVQDVATYCVKRTADKEYLIDWPCSVGWNATSMRVFKADRPALENARLMRVTAQLSDDLPSDVDREHHFSVRLSDGDDNAAFYVPKSRPLHGSKGSLELADGAELRKLLGDGQWHRVTVEVGYFRDQGKEVAHPWISWFVQDGWRSIPESDLAARRAEHSKAVDKWLNPGVEDEKKLKPCCDAMFKRGETEKDRPSVSKLSAGTRSFMWTSRSLECKKDAIRVRQGDKSLKEAADELKNQFSGKNTDVFEDPPKECTEL